ncbi:hypothetical protein [Novilysobacter selenitireducens]|uniref:DUF3619 family protein n=1 Tax=Novilysobacter selenitireducens TaxID=2872639 RepID=A0ABS7T424_9GAMM|nr:hypothetical protein [Lysobacter selenitireducens]MBZ4038617.1 hypothetical protein [Lysobacter selenitireducens]
MNTRPPSPPDTDTAFDQSMRQRYAQALQALPPSTAGALRAARRTALDPASHARSPHPALRWAGAFATVAALALGLRFFEDEPATALTQQVAAVDADEFDAAIGALDENPDLYLWLAANDDLPPTPEP